MSAPPTRVAALAVLCTALPLAGCEADNAELRAWMEETRRGIPIVTEKLAEPKRFEPFRYEPTVEVDPFNARKMKVDALAAMRPDGGVRPDVSRRKEPLEAFPLDNLKLVGNLRRGEVDVALVQVDTALYQVRVGNYVGQNFGKVLRISESEVAIREIVQDAAGDWVQRDTALRLQAQETRK